MKKNVPYILVLLLAAGLIGLFLTGNNKKERTLDERVTLRRQDKIPYGTYVAFKGLEHMFPKAAVHINRYEPGYWDSLSAEDSNQALIIITGKFNADESEMKNLVSFIENGNDVFISARTISYSAGEIMNCSVSSSSIISVYDEQFTVTDSLDLALNAPPFGTKTRYAYPGKRLDAAFDELDGAATEKLGEDAGGRTNFIRLRAGKGNLYLHLAPLAFSNYFLLYKNNIGYYEKAFSVINPQTTKIGWDEYYLNKKFLDKSDEKKKGWLSVLSRYPGLKAALLTAIITLLVYVLLEMRRKQRYIPVVTRPRNDSLDFVKTIGRLYFDKGDHMNLCRKMSAYFLEHVRAKYKLPTGMLDDEFVKHLQHKSGASEAQIRGIVSFIKYLDDAPGINHKQLTDFHKQLETFYKNT